MIAPLTADARISAPVFRRCIARSPSASSETAWPGAWPAACRSIAWPPTMPVAPAASADDLHDAELPRDERRIGAVGLAREQRERLRLQAVARQDRDAVAVDDVQRRPSAAERVVVHGGQVVVDERVGVDELDGARRRKRAASTGVPARLTASAAASGQERPQPLAAGEDAVAHRLADERRTGRRLRQPALERIVDPGPRPIDELGQRLVARHER